MASNHTIPGNPGQGTPTLAKWRECVAFELSQQLRRRSTWVLFGLFLFPLIGVTLDQLAQSPQREILFNAPLFVAQGGSLMGLVSLLVLAGVVGDAATRDVRARITPLIHAAPVGKAAYLGGRFAGACLIAAALAAAILVIRAVVAWTQADPATDLGPFRAAAHLQAYVVVVLPAALIATAVMFALATALRHSLGAWLGAAFVGAGGRLTQSYVGGVLGEWRLATLLDPSGLSALTLMGQTWSPVELNQRLIGTEGLLLWNRALWIAVAGLTLAWTYARFDFSSSTAARSEKRDPRSTTTPDRDDRAPSAATLEAPLTAPRSARDFSRWGRVRQTLSITRDSLREIAPRWSWPIVLLAVLAQLGLTLSALASMGAGTPVLPTTDLVLRTLAPGLQSTSPPVVLAVILLPIVLAGELVWRERDGRVAALTDAAPVPDGARFIGKALALWIVIVALYGCTTLGGVLAQWRLGGRVEPLTYLQVVGLRLVRPLLFACFALSVHVIVNHKYLGHVVALFVITPLFSELLGLEHPLWVIGSRPELWHSSISGFGPRLGPVLLFDLYWGAWALLFALIARLWWVRGVDHGIAERARTALRRGRRLAAPMVAAVTLVALAGGTIFYTTNVLNAYQTGDRRIARQAEYERLYAAFRASPLPHLAATDLDVEIYPERGEAEVRGVHLIVNRTEAPIDTIHIATSPDVETTRLDFDRPAEATIVDLDLRHRTYVLLDPLQPGDSARIEWHIRHAPRGTPAKGRSSAVVQNGTFIPMYEWMPLIGYQANRQITDPIQRRAHGLEAWSPIPRLEDPGAPYDRFGMDQLHVTATVGTALDQIGVAAGRQVGSWTEDGRRYARYETRAPIGNGYAVFSANYALSRADYGDVSIEVFHHPDHDTIVPRLLRGMEASLQQLTERFGPFPYGVLRMIEYPSTGGSLHAASATIWYQELFSFFDVERDPRDIDMVFAVTAHEVAHQFQPVPARMEGRILLSESFAWYAAMGVIETEYGSAHLGRFLDFMRRSYLTPRSRADVPLLRANDAFLGYRKGPFAMYALREYVGEDAVDSAWRRLRERHASAEPPFATSLDLYRELQAVTPDSLHTLLADLLERNTHWELSTERATLEPTASGEWQVRLDVRARKVAVDTLGTETEMPMSDPIEIGVYAESADGADERPLHLEMHRVVAGSQTITIVVPERPTRAGIDPRHLLIDVAPDDNVVEVTATRSAPPVGD